MRSVQPRRDDSDEAVVHRVLKGDKDEYAILVKRYHNLAFALSLRYVKDPECADEMVQETFVRAYENLDRLRKPGNFSSWIAGITRNVCRSHLRKNRKKVLSLDYLAELGIEPTNSGNPDYFDKELIRALRNLFPRLPDKYREILHLKYTGNHSCREIAEFLNLSQSAVLSRLFYARKKLLKMLRKELKK